MKRHWDAWIVALIFIALYLTTLEIRPMFAPDEIRYMEIPREMIETGDYVAPRLNGVRYFEKPVLGYWLTAGAILVFGEEPFAGRLPAALATLISALAVFFLARRITGRSDVAIYSAGAFLTIPIVFGVGTTCILDAPFACFVTLTIVLFHFALDASKERRTGACLLWLAGTGIAAGLAFLTKGFLAFALPVMTYLPYLLWERRWKEMLLLPWIPLVAALAVIAPWAIAVHAEEPDYWRYFLIEEHFSRFFGNEDGRQHPEPFYYFAIVFVCGLGQWLLTLPAVVAGYSKSAFRESWFRFLLCWCFGPLFFLSLSTGKLPTYILPCFAPAAILLAIGLFRFLNSESRREALFAIPMKILAVALILFAPGLGVFLLITRGQLADIPCSASEAWKLIPAAAVAIIAAVAIWRAVRLKNPRGRAYCFLASLVPAMAVAFFVIPDQVLDVRAPNEFLLKHADRVPEDAWFVSNGKVFHSLCWAFRTREVHLLPGYNEQTYGLSFPEEADRRLNSLPDFLDDPAREGRPVVVFLPTSRTERHYRGRKPEWEASVGDARRGHTLALFATKKPASAPATKSAEPSGDVSAK